MTGSRNTCSSCFGNGQCPACEGSGLDPGRSDTQRKCASCSGTGACPVCNGTGAWMEPPPEIFDLGFRVRR